MRWNRIAAATVVLLALAVRRPAAAGEASGPTLLPAERGGFTQALGLPPVYKGHAGLEAVGYGLSGETEAGFYVSGGLFKDLGSPVVGAAGLGLQGYAGMRGSVFDGGARALFTIPSFRTDLGLDYNLHDEQLDFILGLGIPFRRGGIVGNASMVSFRWLPTRGQTVTLGIDWPLWGSNLGETRPKQEAVSLDTRVPARLEERPGFEDMRADLAELRTQAAWIARWTQPFVEVTGEDPVRSVAEPVQSLRARAAATDSVFLAGHTLDGEVARYHLLLDRAFTTAIEHAASGPAGRAGSGADVSRTARRILLEDVLAPYDALLGQRKDPDGLEGSIARAQTRFVRGLLADSSGYARDQVVRMTWVFQSLCEIVEENRVELRRRWEDSRLVWLPLEYALRPEDHDSQAEVDALIELCTSQQPTRGNQVAYLQNEAFQGALAQSILRAEDYHVLWIHDFRGVNAQKEPDEIAYVQVLTYLKAMTARVRDYDRTGKLPVYMIFLDQHYFELNKSRIWLPLLREPMDEVSNLPASRRAWQDEIAAMQDSLRAAVAQSHLLQLERSQFGAKWLSNRIRVHVNITNPADNSFLSHHLAGILPIPDNMMRDHRKIVLYDLSEDDPYRGLAIFTGMGVGEHYVGGGWEDRALLLRGPEALDTKRAAYRLLRTQGFSPDEIPVPLRPRPLPADYDARVEDHLDRVPGGVGAAARVLQLHNETGFGEKDVDVAKAILYSLMPKGSVLRVPDSLWHSYLYGSLLAGSALRGCRVIVIAPTLESAPSAAAVTMARSHGLLGRMIAFENGAAGLIRAQRGYMRVGVYAPRMGVRDLAARYEQAMGMKSPVEDDELRLDNPEFAAAVGRTRAILDSVGYKLVFRAGEDSTLRPKLHLKANLFVSGEAWDGLLSRPEWGAVYREYIVFCAGLGPDSLGNVDLDRVGDTSGLAREAQRLLSNYVAGITPEEREKVLAFMTVGSANMDYRSMLMDGEVMVTLTGGLAIHGVIDFLLLAGLCDWPTTPAELDRVLPPPNGMMRTMGGLMKRSL